MVALCRINLISQTSNQQINKQKNGGLNAMKREIAEASISYLFIIHPSIRARPNTFFLFCDFIVMITWFFL